MSCLRTAHVGQGGTIQKGSRKQNCSLTTEEPSVLCLPNSLKVQWVKIQDEAAIHPSLSAGPCVEGVETKLSSQHSTGRDHRDHLLQPVIALGRTRGRGSQGQDQPGGCAKSHRNQGLIPQLFLLHQGSQSGWVINVGNIQFRFF